MLSSALSQSPHAGMVAAGMILFILVFIGVLGWVFRKGAKTGYQEMSGLPLKDDSQKGPLK